ncbi:uncharacterized protein P884DRAFT_260417 [Thermothelomyces heterothallicus CBS 202.75]|uniref:uncharacterized protein n=1 Tax=Thermothelomyces heterothallicus CBS 202.75 TaxID=1149848 RepID=UPI0037439A3C
MTLHMCAARTETPRESHGSKTRIRSKQSLFKGRQNTRFPNTLPSQRAFTPKFFQVPFDPSPTRLQIIVVFPLSRSARSSRRRRRAAERGRLLAGVEREAEPKAGSVGENGESAHSGGSGVRPRSYSSSLHRGLGRGVRGPARGGTRGNGREVAGGDRRKAACGKRRESAGRNRRKAASGERRETAGRERREAASRERREGTPLALLLIRSLFRVRRRPARNETRGNGREVAGRNRRKAASWDGRKAAGGDGREAAGRDGRETAGRNRRETAGREREVTGREWREGTPLALLLSGALSSVLSNRRGDGLLDGCGRSQQDDESTSHREGVVRRRKTRLRRSAEAAGSLGYVLTAGEVGGRGWLIYIPAQARQRAPEISSFWLCFSETVLAQW